MTSLGVGLSSLSKVGEQLYRVKLPAGATLKQAKDGLFSSSATLLDGSSSWAKFEQVAPGLVFDPTAVAVAAALAQINQKLDGIQDSIDRMFGYLRTKDKAADLAALDDLKAVLDEYRYNLDNAQFKRLKLALAQDVNSHAQKRIRELQAHLSEASHKKGLLELRGQAADATAAALDDLKDYQLAVYLYSFSSFLGVMLLENYDEGYLAMKAEDIREKAREYRKAYTACFDAIESRNRQTLDSYVLGGISAGLSGLGHLVEMTIFADATDIDETLADAAHDVDGSTRRRTTALPIFWRRQRIRRQAVCRGHRCREPGLQQAVPGSDGRRERLCASGRGRGAVGYILQYWEQRERQLRRPNGTPDVGAPRYDKTRQLSIVERPAGLLALA